MDTWHDSIGGVAVERECVVAELDWADPSSMLDLVEQVESVGVEAVLLSSVAHVTAWDWVRLCTSDDLECGTP